MSTSAVDAAFALTTGEIDGARVRWSDSAAEAAADDEGALGSPPLLLVNGLGANLEMWAPLRRALAGRRTIAYDAPGTGDSATPARPSDMAQMATVAAGVLDAVGVGPDEPVDVLGYSFGGFLAQELARADHRVRKLVLAATGAGWSTSFTDIREMGGRTALRIPLALGIMLTPSRYYLRPEGQRFIRKVFGDRDGDYGAADQARSDRPPSGLGYLYQLLAASRWSSRSWLHELVMPALVLSGERDAIATVGAGQYLTTHLPQAKQIVLPGVGHSFLLEDDLAGVAAEIIRFLDA